MDFEIDQSRFLSALNLAQTVTDRRSTMPILANVLLRADKDNRLVCSATDMMISLTESVDAEVKKAGSLTLGVRHLCNVVKTLPAGGVRVTALDNHWAQIVAGRSEFKLMGMPDGEYPELPDPTSMEFTEVPSHQLADLIHKTLFSVSTDEARVNLNGALFECDGKQAVMVSTDGHRLTKFSLPFAGPKLSEGIIIPRKGMIEIRKVLDRVEGDVGVVIADQYLHIRSERLTLSIKLNAVAFPPYQQVIPKKHKRRATISRNDLAGALRQAEVMAPEKTATVRVHLEKGTLKLTADNPDLGVSNLEINVDYDDDALTAGFNARYLLEALEAIDTQDVHLDFQGELDPCVLRPVDGPDFLAVVMPMRI
jgi:DNA polymerase-3 subunit beta